MTILHNCKRDVQPKKPWKVFSKQNDELAGMRPVRGRILLPSCILFGVSSRAPSVEYEMSLGDTFPNSFSFLLQPRAQAADEKE
jgi:hypothetical protein